MDPKMKRLIKRRDGLGIVRVVVEETGEHYLVQGLLGKQFLPKSEWYVLKEVTHK